MSTRKVFNSDSEGEEVEEEEREERTKTEHTAGSDGLVLESGDESDSDAAPDDVTFEASRMSVLSKVKQAVDHINKEKEKLRTKRRQKQDQYTTQKKQKRESRRLPDDVLAALTDQPISTKSKSDKKSESEDTSKQTEEERSTQEEINDMLGFSGSDGEQEPEDFIPLEQSGIRAVCVQDAVRASITSAEKAAEFKHNMLYGNRIRRENTKDKLAKKQKKKARFH